MEKFKLLFTIVLLYAVATVRGQYSEKWNAGGNTYIGCENMDNDDNKEIVTISATSFSMGDTIFIIDGVTGNIDFKYICDFPYAQYPKLVDVDSDGKFEIIFLGKTVDDPFDKFHLISFNGSSTLKQEKTNNSAKIKNYPNPFSESTTIRYNVPTSNIVTIKLYDPNGRLLKTILNEQKSKGDYELNFKSGDLQSGTYLYQVQVGDSWEAQKMLIIK